MITTEEYKALAGCIAPDNDPRDYLKGILIEANGTFVATNGAIIAYVETGERIEGMTESSIVVKPWKLPRLKKDHNRPIIIDCVDGAFFAKQGAVETRLETIRNVYPTWRRADAHASRPLRRTSALPAIVFDQRRLTPLACEYLTMEFGQDALDPIRITCSAPLERLKVTLMPCRI